MLGLLAQNSSSSGGAAGAGIFIVVYIAFLLLIIVSMWKVFTKMGQPGWYGIIPVFNYVVIAKLSGKDWWYGLLIIVPCIGWIFAIILDNELAKLFGKGIGYTLGIIFLPFIFLPLLAFSDARYEGPQVKAF